MIIPMLISLSVILWVPMMAQTKDSITHQTSPIHRNDSLLISKLRKTRIVLKDGTIKKNCHVKEIHDYWIVYEKEESLHDLMIEEIERIEIMDGTMHAVFFDEKKKPVVGSYVY